MDRTIEGKKIWGRISDFRGEPWKIRVVEHAKSKIDDRIKDKRKKGEKKGRKLWNQEVVI